MHGTCTCAALQSRTGPKWNILKKLGQQTNTVLFVTFGCFSCLEVEYTCTAVQNRAFLSVLLFGVVLVIL